MALHLSKLRILLPIFFLLISPYLSPSLLLFTPFFFFQFLPFQTTQCTCQRPHEHQLASALHSSKALLGADTSIPGFHTGNTWGHWLCSTAVSSSVGQMRVYKNPRKIWVFFQHESTCLFLQCLHQVEMLLSFQETLGQKLIDHSCHFRCQRAKQVFSIKYISY